MLEKPTIDATRGLGAIDLRWQEGWRKLFSNPVSGLKNSGLKEYARRLIASGFNLKPGVEPITPEQVSLSNRASEAISKATQYFNHYAVQYKLPKVALVTKPTYSLMADLFVRQGWEITTTDDFTSPHKTSDIMLDIERKLGEANGEITVLIINSPNNPTGDIYTEEDLRHILGLMKKYPNLHVLSDVVYEKIAKYDGGPVPTLFALADTDLRKRIIEVSGTSKTVMFGDLFSAGYAISDKKVISEMKELERIGLIRPVTNKSFAIRDTKLIGMITALAAPKSHFENLQSGYENRRRLLGAQIEQYGILGLDWQVAPDLNYISFDFRRLMTIGITPKDHERVMFDELGILIMPPRNNGSSHLVRHSIGGKFVHKSITDFADERYDDAHLGFDRVKYQNHRVSSSIELEQFVVQKSCESVHRLLERAGHEKKWRLQHTSRDLQLSVNRAASR